MVDHVAKKAAKAIRACSQMQRIKGLRPKQKRQLYRSVVLPVVDYAAPVWHATDFRGGGQKIRLLNQVQRLGARQILRAFKTTALPVLEVEASLDPVVERLHRRAVQQVVSICMGPDDNPAKQLLLRMKDQPGRMWSPARTTFEHVRQRLQGNRRLALSPEPVWIQPPWEGFTSMVEMAPKDEARAAARVPTQNGRYAFFTDGSVNNGVSGGAVVQGYRGQLQTLWKGTIGWATTCTILEAELVAIRQALQALVDDDGAIQMAGIITDSQDALKEILKGNKARRGRNILRDIARLLQQLQGRKRIRLQWTPAHADVDGNVTADLAAKATTRKGQRPQAEVHNRYRSAEGFRKIVQGILDQRPMYSGYTEGRGSYTWKLDQALPGSHTRALYAALSSDEAAILVQARTDKTRLNSSLARIRVVGSEQCECGRGAETVQHVLLSCPRWTQQREVFRQTLGGQIGDIGRMLGAWSARQDYRTGRYLLGPKDKWRADIRVVKATIAFLSATGRFIDSGVDAAIHPTVANGPT